jgi:hypothetical protein
MAIRFFRGLVATAYSFAATISVKPGARPALAPPSTPYNE